jgi:hypothetical protein
MRMSHSMLGMLIAWKLEGKLGDMMRNGRADGYYQPSIYFLTEKAGKIREKGVSCFVKRVESPQSTILKIDAFRHEDMVGIESVCQGSKWIDGSFVHGGQWPPKCGENCMEQMFFLLQVCNSHNIHACCIFYPTSTLKRSQLPTCSRQWCMGLASEQGKGRRKRQVHNGWNEPHSLAIEVCLEEYICICTGERLTIYSEH